MATHTHGWPDERPDWRSRNYPLLVPPPRSFAMSAARFVLNIVAWVAIWLLVGQVAPNTFERFWLFVPLMAAYLLGYYWRATE